MLMVPEVQLIGCLSTYGVIMVLQISVVALLSWRTYLQGLIRLRLSRGKWEGAIRRIEQLLIELSKVKPVPAFWSSKTNRLD